MNGSVRAGFVHRVVHDRIRVVLVGLSLVLTALPAVASPAPAAAAEGDVSAGAVALVNSASSGYSDYTDYVSPYLDQFGVFVTEVDLASDPVPAPLGDESLIIIGHPLVDPDGTHLDAAEQTAIADAVAAGTGLVSFDSGVWIDTATPRYSFIDTIFTFNDPLSTSTSTSGLIFPTPGGHYITDRHSPGSTLITGTMTLATLDIPADVDALVTSAGSPLVAATAHGSGNAVQWASIDWMSHDVLGPISGMDDVLWRSLVWAARKPFVMQSMPPFVTMRMDDVDGSPSLDWVEATNDHGFKPWLGVFYNDMDPSVATGLSGIVAAGNATVSIHSNVSANSGEFFYFDHSGGVDRADADLAASFAEGTAWHDTYGIPVSEHLVGHYYEVGSNALTGGDDWGLDDWGVEFIGMPMEPGLPHTASDWLAAGPYRLSETGAPNDQATPAYYADYYTMPSGEEFFACFSEIRGVTSYEWLTGVNTATATEAIDVGTEWLTRGLDSLILASLFTHEYEVDGIAPGVWRDIVAGVTAAVADYDPIYVTMDDACRYARAIHDSSIASATYSAGGELTITLDGTTDSPTKVAAFFNGGSGIEQAWLDVDAFSGSTSTTYTAGEHAGFEFDAVSGPQLEDIPFDVTVRAVDAGGLTVTGYSGTATLSDLSGTATPTTASFTGGVWSGSVTIADPYNADVLTVTDGAATGSSVAFDVLGMQECPCSIWDETATPTADANKDGIHTIEVGVRFQSLVDGYITGFRFYKGAGNTGTHTGHLWANDGTQLAEAEFTNETVSGWQQVDLSAPVEIVAGQTYVASYYSSDGYYAYTNGDLASGVDNPPLRALADGEDGPNGVYLYDSSGFPTQTHQSSNYWVDVVFVEDLPEYSLWDDATVPGTLAVSDGRPIEVGVKFRADQAGEVLGLRFYKGIANTGTHTGHLWDGGGTQLAEAVFTDETASGWQEVRFGAPVPIDADTTYIASYFSQSGYFAIDGGYFATSGYPNAPLYALQHNEEGPNGVFRYDSSGYPTGGNGANYWVDIIFRPTAAIDDVAPEIVATAPSDGAVSVNPDTAVTATFSEGIDEASLSGAFVLRDPWDVAIPAAVTYDAASRTAVLDPTDPLAYAAQYTATIATAVTDLAGNPLAADVVWSFTTAAEPTPLPDEGPGGPILVIVDAAAANPFGRYLGDILLAEGLNEYTITDMAGVTATTLADYDVVVLAEMTLDTGQVTMLTDWVGAGGNLIAMRPDAALAPLLGLNAAAGSLADGYLLVDTAATPGAGIVAETIQYHGTADYYTLGGATEVAALYSSATAPASYPAVTLNEVGTSGGQAAAFTFDLARSVVLTRQGNPDWVDINGDGSPGPVRADDLFHNSTDPDWVDLDKVAIPQADELQRLLANLITHLNLDRMPLPRLWYLPRGEKAAVLLTSDDHASSNVPGRMDQYKSLSPAGCSVDDWECVRSSMYIYAGTSLTEAQATSYTADGFEIGVHVDTGCANYDLAGLQAYYDSQLGAFASRFPSLALQDSERTHCIAWSGWAMQAEVKDNLGIRLDTNYYYWPGAWLNNRPGMFTGSGFPMRFADLDGSIFDVYQATTQMTDESGQTYPYTIDSLLDKAIGSEGYYGVFTANMHTSSTTSAGANAIIASAQARGVPIVSGRQMADWLDGRNTSSFENLAWDGSVLSFDVTIGAGANGLEAMVPTESADATLTGINLDGTPVAYDIDTVKGFEYATFPAGVGTYAATYGDTPPEPIDLDDSTVAEFSAGSGACSVVETDDGELILAPTEGTEFDGTTLPAGWTSTPWSGGVGTSVGGGLATVDGALLTADTYYGPGRSLEFVATFTGGSTGGSQHIGFGDALSAAPWAIFSTGFPGGTTLLARTAPGTSVDTPLPTVTLNEPHRFRIEWLTDEVVFYVDGSEVARHATSIAASMRPVASDQAGGPTISIDWMRMSPYGSPCTFDSRVFDAGEVVTWETMAWTADEPTGTAVAMSYRTGDTAVPDASWSGWVPASGPSPTTIGGTSQYIQYQAGLSSTDDQWTPSLADVAFTYGTGDTTAPTIADRDPAPEATEVAHEANVVVTFSEPMDQVTLDSTSFRIRADGATSDVAAAVTAAGDTATLDPVDPLDPGTTYHVTVAHTVADLAGNPLGTDDTWSFTTTAALSVVDTTTADFSAGSGACAVDPTVGDGAIRLPLTVDETFDGTTLPSGWTAAGWPGKTGASATVASGTLILDRARAATDATYGPGVALEFATTFQPETFQHVGFVAGFDFNAPWIIFSTSNTTGQLYARTNPGADVLIPGDWIGSEHTYRIEWDSTEIRFLVDGALVHTQVVAIGGPLRVIASDINTDTYDLVVDWITLTPYLSPCSFDSRVFDAGGPADWLELAWTGEGTGVAFETRTGNTTDPDDGTWSEWAATTTTMPGPNARYALYRVTLSTSDPDATPIVESVTLTYEPVTNSPPDAVDDTATTDEDAAVTIDVLANDADVDGDTLAVTAVSDPANGTAEINPDGTVTYTPDADYNGTDSFTYDLSDGNGGIDTATVSINVNAVNDPPSFQGGGDVTVAEDSGPYSASWATDVSAGPADESGQTVSFVVSLNDNPSLFSIAPAISADGVLSFTPAPDAHGIATIATYAIDDGPGTTASAPTTFLITVTSVNDAPVADDDAYITVEDTVLNVAAPGVLSNDSDVDGDALTAVLVTAVANGTLTLNADGSFTYTPDPNFHGADSFTYKANDGTVDSNVATVTITVTSVNDAPVAVDDSASVDEDGSVHIPVLANDTDVDGDTLAVDSVTSPANGTAVIETDDTVTYTPNADFNGTDTFTYEACDLGGSCDDATVTITINPVNDAPVANDDSATTDEDTPLNVDVLANDTDVDGDTLAVDSVTSPANGTAVIETDDTVTYTPNADFNGTDTFTYEACDLGGSCDDATVTITVSPVNDAPVADDDGYSTDEDTVLTVAAPGVLTNDSDVDGDTLTTSVVAPPMHGSLSLNTDGSFTYTPNTDFNGGDSFTYEVSDGNGGTDTATVTITINAVNDPPVANDDSAVTSEDTAVTIDVLANDTDVDGDPLTPAVVVAPTSGTLALHSDGSFTYTPNTDFNGTDSFTYTISDGNGGTDTGTVTITINPVNDAPVANDDSATTDEDTPLNVDVLANDTDVDGDTLAVDSVTSPANGTAVIETDDTVTYTPNADFNGTDTFTYEACDLGGSCDDATVTITINPVNDAPVANDDSATTDEDTPLNVDVLANDTDVDGDTLAVDSVTSPANGTAVIETDDTVTYTPNADFNGTDTFTYEACDLGGSCDDATVTITINPVNDAPVANDDSATTDEDTPLNVDVLANDTDVDGDTLAVDSVTSPANGTAVINADDTVTYTPNADFNGTDTFTYEACDLGGSCDDATVTITVSPVNDAPVADDDAYSTDEDTVLTVAAPGVLTNDADVDGDALTAVLVTGVANGTLALNSDGSFEYTPNADFNGTDTFTYTANDGTVNSNLATVTITINAVNDPPVANDDSAVTSEDTAVTIDVLANDTDVDGDPLTPAVVVAPTSGTLALHSDGSFTYTPNTDFNGTDTFTYEACDLGGSCDDATVTITINPVNDAPVANDDSATTDEDTPLNVDVLANDTDVDGDTLAVDSVTSPANGTAVIETDDTVTYTPNADFNGTDTFTYEACDLGGSCDDATVTITINPVNDAPVANDDSATTDEDTPLNVDVLANDTDVDGDTLAVDSVTSPANGTAVIETDDTVTYTPNADFNGTDTFTYEACDLGGSCDDATVTITVSPVNDAPVADDDAYSTDEDTVLTVAAPGVLTNDADVDGDALTAVLVTGVANGTLTLNADGSFTYTPNANYYGPDSFTYTANDGTVDSNEVTVTITINAVNDAPVADDDAYSTDEDTVLTVAAPGVLTNDADVDGDALTAVLVTGVANGTLALNSDGSFEYTPNADFNGTDTFTYTANDGTVNSNLATVTITINAVNDPPVANAGGPYTGKEGSPITLDASGSSDVDSAISYAWDLDADGEFDDATGVVTTISFADNGTYTVALRVEDDLGLFDTHEAIVDVANVAPTVTVDEALVTVGEGAPIHAANTGTYGDVGDDVVSLSASIGDVVANDDGTWSWSYAATDGPEQSQTVTITATDDDGATTEATFDLTVDNVEPTVTLTGDTSVAEGAVYTVDLSVTDPGDDTVTACSLHWGDGSPVADCLGVGTLTHIYADGPDMFTVSVDITDEDGTYLTAATLTVDVANVAPTVTVDEALVTVGEGAPIHAANTGTYGDVGDDVVSLSASIGDVVANDDGTWSWSYAATDGPEQSQTVTITATDDDGATTEATFDLTVDNVEPTVTLTGDTSVAEGAVYTVDLSVTDPGDDTVTACSLHWGDGSPVADCLGVGTLTHIYADGPDMFTVSVDITDEDGTYLTAATLTVDVANVAPTVTVDPESQTGQYSDAIAPVTISATDVATDQMTASVVGDLPSAFSLTPEPCDADATTCTWRLDGVAEVPAGIYTITVEVSDEDGDASPVDIEITVEPEAAQVVFGDNPVAVQVDSPGSDASQEFTLYVQVVPEDDGTPGDVINAVVAVNLSAVGPGSGGQLSCGATDDDGWVTCSGTGFGVNTYVVEVTVHGGYYAGYAEDVLVVYDPSLGFTTGGGWFYWPGTEDLTTGSPGDKTNFGYTMKYNKKGKKVQGSLLLIRHLPDGSIYRVKSNALYGLALGEFDDGDETYGWASFSGKSTYVEPGWPDPVGNHEFIAYVEDRNEPGTGVDRVWIEVWDKEGNVIPVMSMSGEPDAASNAEEIGGGNLVVPHGAGGAKTK